MDTIKTARADLLAAVRAEVESIATIAERDDLSAFTFARGGDGSRDLRVHFGRAHFPKSTPETHVAVVTIAFADPLDAHLPRTASFTIRRSLFATWVVTRKDSPIPIGTTRTLAAAVAAACGDAVVRLVDLLDPTL